MTQPRSRLEAVTSLITATGVLLGVGFTAFGLYYTAQTLRTSQEGQITDRYTKAAELLASPAVDARLGAIYALRRLADDSPKDRPTIHSLLAAYVRNHDFCPAQQPAPQCSGPWSSNEWPTRPCACRPTSKPHSRPPWRSARVTSSRISREPAFRS